MFWTSVHPRRSPSPIIDCSRLHFTFLSPPSQTPAENDVRIMMWKFRLMCFPAVPTRLRVVFPSFSSSSSEGSPMSRHRQQGRGKKWRSSRKIERKLEKLQQQKDKRIFTFSCSRFCLISFSLFLSLGMERVVVVELQPTDRSLNFNNSLIYVERYFMMAGVGARRFSVERRTATEKKHFSLEIRWKIVEK